VDPATQWPKHQSDYPHHRGGLWRRGGHTRPRRRRPRPTAAERRRAVGGEGEEESCVVGNPPPPLLPAMKTLAGGRIGIASQALGIASGAYELDQKKVECEPNKEAALEKFEWISDDENVLDNEDIVTGGYHEYINIIGFHPYKEIIFLDESLKRGLAYHLSSSKVEDIGNLYPTNLEYELINEQFITASFQYTHCFM